MGYLRSTSAAVLLLSAGHWKKQVQSRKQFSSIFRADAYCTFSSCPVTAKLSITKQNIHADSVIVEVKFTGSTQHVTGETKARNISLSVRNDMQQHFQMTHTAPSKEYHQRLIALSSEQYASGNRNGVAQQFGRPHAGDYKLRIQTCIRAYHKACTHD